MQQSHFTPPAGLPLREAHCHLAQFGLQQQTINLADARSANDMLHAITGAPPLTIAGQPRLLADSARPESWEPRGWPTLADLDAATPDAPFCAWCFDYHALIANSAALRIAGIDPSTPDPAGGIIGRDNAGGLTGVVYENAATQVWYALVPPDALNDPQILQAARNRLESMGFTEIHDLKAQPWLPTCLAQTSAANLYPGTQTAPTHPTRFVLYPLVEDLLGLTETASDWETSTVRLGGGKIFVDGTLNSRTAWMLRDYADAHEAGQPGHPRGLPMMTPDQIDDAVRTCDAHNLPIAAHAIGDAAVRAVLDSIERVRPQTPGARIEHAELIDEADIPRFAELGVTCSVQPCHMLYDIEALTRALPDRLDRVLPLRELIEAGCVPGESLIFGSDAPIVRPDPADSVQAAVNRSRVGEHTAIAPQHAITEQEAWRCFTDPRARTTG